MLGSAISSRLFWHHDDAEAVLMSQHLHHRAHETLFLCPNQFLVFTSSLSIPNFILTTE